MKIGENVEFELVESAGHGKYRRYKCRGTVKEIGEFFGRKDYTITGGVILSDVKKSKVKRARNGVST